MDANRKYKDTLFSELFSKPENLRELYNALADTNYGEETPIEINTLDDVFFKDLKNDVSFTIDNRYVVLLEHQSTINANMPLRCLMYIARVLEKITDERALYRENLLKIPTPEFFVLYNGEKPFPSETTLQLSDAYKGRDKAVEKFGHLDLTVRVVNINPGRNDELLKKSETLHDYTSFIERVRHNQRNGLVARDAIKDAINWSVSQGIFGEFLVEHKSEVTSMIFTEFNIDIAKEVWQEEARENAFEEFQAALDAKDADIAAKDADIAAKDADIAAKDAELSKLAAEIAAQAELIKELQS